MIGGGSGFGLFISKSIVQLHGGTLEVFSAGEGKGCSFCFKIPMTRGEGTEESCRGAVVDAGDGKVDDGHDDHASNRLSPGGLQEEGNHYDVGVGVGVGDDNEIAMPSPRRHSRGVIDSRSRSPSHAAVAAVTGRSPHLSPRRLSPPPHHCHRSVEVVEVT